ncbi:hypothetical protein Pcinc_025982 [Petrolisthes cinctipes]|uniref:Small ribosomal subunit protein uS2m n=1 Tax=Petrolisthes cinctipes TaxID=88211 RepID=A0AAE1F859_PETCI|nr:hypothetical protein Pcinc_025982 [Petrolisthes cinctipes]
MAALSRRIFSHYYASCWGGVWQRSLASSSSPALTSSPAVEVQLPQSPAATTEHTESPMDQILKESLKHPDYFQVAQLFTVEDLFQARVHLGHVEGTGDPHMNQFIFGSRLGHHIIDLDQTAAHLRQALNIIAHIAFREGIILFVGRLPQHQYLIECTAKECGEYSHCRHWQGGVLTNSTKQFGSITRLPDLVILLHSMYTAVQQHYAIRDAAKMLIPTVAIVDTNCNPKLVTYPIPGNDDSAISVELYCRLFKNAVLKGKEKRKEVLGL